MMRAKVVVAAFVVTFVLGGAVRGQSGATPREYVVPNHGRLILALPASLKDASKPLSEPPSVTLAFRPAAGDAFSVKATTVWLDSASLATMTPDKLRATVEAQAQDLIEHAVEQKAMLKELQGVQATGFYFSVTDRAPAPGEYKYMSQGVLVTGELMTAFTILHREATCRTCDQLIQMFEQSKYAR